MRLFAVSKVRRGTLCRNDFLPLVHLAVGTLRRDYIAVRNFAVGPFVVRTFAIGHFAVRKSRRGALCRKDFLLLGH